MKKISTHKAQLAIHLFFLFLEKSKKMGVTGTCR